MFGIREFRVKDRDYVIVDFPFSSEKFTCQGMNTTVIVFSSLEITEMDVVCERFINLATVTCKKVAIQANRYINLGEIRYGDLDKDHFPPNIKVGSPERYTSLEMTDELRKPIYDLFWNAIDDSGISVKKMKEANKFLEEFVQRCSPRLLRKV